MKITSLTFLFTDLRGSTELYERVGDLVAFDLVSAHFRVLNEHRRGGSGRGGQDHRRCGDGDVPDAGPGGGGGASGCAMRCATSTRGREREDLLLKIGIHEGPCIAVTLNERQDYFGQTVNIASRVQGLATSSEIFATGAVIEDPRTSGVLEKSGIRAAKPEPAAARNCLGAEHLRAAVRQSILAPVGRGFGRPRGRVSCVDAYMARVPAPDFLKSPTR